MNKIIITTSWDDGHPLDEKLSSLLLEHRIPGTFYIPISSLEMPLMKKEEIKNLITKFEIGGHTLTHKVLPPLSEEEMKEEIMKGKEELEKICDEIISFAYPKGRYNQKVIGIVKKAGFKGARTAEMFHYKIRNPYEHHPTIHAVNRILASRSKQILATKDKDMSISLLSTGTIFKTWEVIAKKTLDYVLEHGGIWHLWGHSWEINDNNDWQKLSQVLCYAKKKGKEYKAEFLTNGEIFDEVIFS